MKRKEKLTQKDIAILKTRNLKIIKKIIKNREDTKALSELKLTPLMLVSYYGYKEVFDYLIELGADVDAYCPYGSTALLCAVEGENEEIAFELIKMCKNIDRKRWGFTPLMIAIGSGSIELMDALIKKGADVNAQNDVGNTALMIAVLYRRPKHIKGLLETGKIEIRAKNKYGDTALSIAKRHMKGAVQGGKCMRKNNIELDKIFQDLFQKLRYINAYKD